jgi:hypothetical protein
LQPTPYSSAPRPTTSPVPGRRDTTDTDLTLTLAEAEHLHAALCRALDGEPTPPTGPEHDDMLTGTGDGPLDLIFTFLGFDEPVAIKAPSAKDTAPLDAPEG